MSIASYMEKMTLNFDFKKLPLIRARKMKFFEID
jgi:hypothetical protein